MALEYHQLEIASIEPTANNAVCISFVIPQELKNTFEFKPGQHLTLRHRLNEENLRRFYSICTPSTPSMGQSGEQLRIGVRQINDGRFSGFLNNEAKVGDRLEVLAPRGHFCLTEESAGKHIIAFAAGSGITPVYSIVYSHLLRNTNATATLVYGNRATRSIMLCGDLNNLKDIYLERLQIIHMLTQEQQDIDWFNGRIDKKSLYRLADGGLIEPDRAVQIFICGPVNMIDETQSALIELGATPAKISVERFTAVGGEIKPASTQTLKIVESGVGVSFLLDGVEKEFTITDPQDTVLSAAQRSGFELPFSCAGGMCATCRCKLVEGEVQMAANYALEPWELEAGFVLACQSRPKTSKIRLDFDAT
jgi:ring-1,2-phenylacetyl-CoA epoxidase subunit PaaE